MALRLDKAPEQPADAPPLTLDDGWGWPIFTLIIEIFLSIMTNRVAFILKVANLWIGNFSAERPHSS